MNWALWWAEVTLHPHPHVIEQGREGLRLNLIVEASVHKKTSFITSVILSKLTYNPTRRYVLSNSGSTSPELPSSESLWSEKNEDLCPLSRSCCYGSRCWPTNGRALPVYQLHFVARPSGCWCELLPDAHQQKYSHPQLQSWLNTRGVKAILWPAGTPSNYHDWESGEPLLPFGFITATDGSKEQISRRASDLGNALKKSRESVASPVTELELSAGWNGVINIVVNSCSTIPGKTTRLAETVKRLGIQHPYFEPGKGSVLQHLRFLCY